VGVGGEDDRFVALHPGRELVDGVGDQVARCRGCPCVGDERRPLGLAVHAGDVVTV